MPPDTRRSPGIPGPVEIAVAGDDEAHGSKQLAIWTTPAARAAGRSTSHKAAESVAPRASDTEASIIDVLRRGSFTTDEIAEQLERHPPTISSAVSRLSKRGVVSPIGERMSKRRRPMTVWMLVDSKLSDDRTVQVPHRGAPEIQARSLRRIPREAKPAFLAGDDRTHVLFRNEDEVVATVRGFHGTYEVRCDSRGRWSCSCPNFVELCSHAEAVSLVTGVGRA